MDIDSFLKSVSEELDHEGEDEIKEAVIYNPAIDTFLSNASFNVDEDVIKAIEEALYIEEYEEIKDEAPTTVFAIEVTGTFQEVPSSSFTYDIIFTDDVISSIESFQRTWSMSWKMKKLDWAFTWISSWTVSNVEDIIAACKDIETIVISKAPTNYCQTFGRNVCTIDYTPPFGGFERNIKPPVKPGKVSKSMPYIVSKLSDDEQTAKEKAKLWKELKVHEKTSEKDLNRNVSTVESIIASIEDEEGLEDYVKNLSPSFVKNANDTFQRIEEARANVIWVRNGEEAIETWNEKERIKKLKYFMSLSPDELRID